VSALSPGEGHGVGWGGGLSTTQIRVLSLVKREVTRFMKIKRQTIGAPLLETFLYISVFGGALGSRIHYLHGYRYIEFVVPGLIMMAWAVNAFANNSSSILQQKFQHAIDDQLSSPASPFELLLGFTLGGFLRGGLVAAITYAVAGVLIGLPVSEPLVLIPAIALTGLFFAQAGVLVGVRAQQFDDVALYQQFVIQPLIFLGGVFYSGSLLPEPFRALTHFNPIYYMIGLIRYGFIGYKETNILLSLGLLLLATGLLFAWNLRIFTRGTYLRT
jgi:ABC-2 type transport system permease protein